MWPFKRKVIHPSIKEFGSRLVNKPESFEHERGAVWNNHILCMKTAILIRVDDDLSAFNISFDKDILTKDELSYLKGCVSTYLKSVVVEHLTAERKSVLKMLSPENLENK